MGEIGANVLAPLFVAVVAVIQLIRTEVEGGLLAVGYVGSLAGVIMLVVSRWIRRTWIDVRWESTAKADAEVNSRRYLSVQDPKDVWERPELDEAVNTALSDPQKTRVLVLTGESGIGKSVFVKHLLCPTLRNSGWKVPESHVSGYRQIHGFKHEVEVCLAELRKATGLSAGAQLPKDMRALIVFDQFEQFLLRERERKNREAVLNEIINLTSIPGLVVLLVVRNEFYRRLLAIDDGNWKEVVNNNAVDAPGMGINNAINDKLNDLVSDSSVREKCLSELRLDTGEALPLEIRLVLARLADIKRAKGEVGAHDYPRDGKQGLINEFLISQTEGPERELAWSILYALSASRRRSSARDLARVTHWDLRSVEQVLKNLTKRELIVRFSTGEVEIAHDYLAERFHELSGSQLDTTPRDNITHFIDVINSPGRKGIMEVGPDSKGQWQLVLWSGLFAVLVLRLAGPWYGGMGFWAWLEDLGGVATYRVQVAVAAPYIDLLYVPSLLASTSSSFYQYRFHRYFLVAAAETQKTRATSYASLAVCYTMVLAGVAFPRLWLACAGVGGLAVGVRLLLLVRSQGGRRNPQAQDYLRLAGWVTVLNMAVITALGAGYWHTIYGWTVGAEIVRELMAVEILAALVFTVYMLYLTGEHTAKGKAAGFLGLVDR